MYAVIEQGGKQYKVSEGDWLDIELTDVAPDATKLELNKVLFVGDERSHKIGSPYVDGATVVASFAGTAGDAVTKGEKVFPMYFRRRKSSRKRIGHRQKYLRIHIEKIQA